MQYQLKIEEIKCLECGADLKIKTLDLCVFGEENSLRVKAKIMCNVCCFENLYGGLLYDKSNVKNQRQERR